MRRRAAGGQAAIELLAAVPLLVLAALLAWQLVAVVGAGMSAEHRVRERALRVARAPAGGVTTVGAEAPVPGLVPGGGGMVVRARGAVRVP